MKRLHILRPMVGILTGLFIGGTTVCGQLYSENYDDSNASTRWTENAGPTDQSANFAFDYSTVGIPSAPNSGGTTIGMKLTANLFSDTFGGFSVSPNSESFTGDYVLSYDMWQSYQGTTYIPRDGPFAPGGGIIRGAGSGQTNLTYGGILSSGTFANYPGTADGTWFAATGDGDSGSDYRVYSQDRSISYQLPAAASYDPLIDDFAEYLAKDENGDPTRNASHSTLYTDNFGNETAPAAMQALFPNTIAGQDDADFDIDNDIDGRDFLGWQRGFGIANGANVSDGDANGDGDVDDGDLARWVDQFGGEPVGPPNRTDVGVLGFAWRQQTITKVGDLVTWAVDGIDLITLDVSGFVAAPGGNNILFGYTDTNTGSANLATNPDAEFLLFGLVDNVEVNTIPPSISSVPEPGSLLIIAIGIACLAGGRFRMKGC